MPDPNFSILSLIVRYVPLTSDDKQDSFISLITTKMEFMNKTNLKAVALSNLEQQIMKTDSDKRERDTRLVPATLTSTSLEEPGTALGPLGFTELAGRSLQNFTNNTQF